MWGKDEKNPKCICSNYLNVSYETKGEDGSNENMKSFCEILKFLLTGGQNVPSKIWNTQF